jgi:methylmalonyl-CoA mutase N-terminal domain/subunit
VGVNRFTLDHEEQPELLRVDEALGEHRRRQVAAVRTGRDQAVVTQRLADLGQAAQGSGNLMPHILAAVKAEATVGEVCDTLRAVFGEYQEHLVL